MNRFLPGTVAGIRRSSSRPARVFLLCQLILLSSSLCTNASNSSTTHQSCRTIVVGFVGGMRRPDDPTQGVVQIGSRLRGLQVPSVDVRIYRHWFWRRAYKWVCAQFDLNGDGTFSTYELLNGPRVVIYGHSLGGWAVLELSRKLNSKGIPVSLTVQIDSVGIGDEEVPSNVRDAANFYQRTARLLRGESRIKPKDSRATTVIGNFLIEHVDHEGVARRPEVSRFIIDRVLSLCAPKGNEEVINTQ